MIIEIPTVEEIREYEQLRTPDFALLASLINRAKGAERSMAQFAEDTEIGASTLSRVINMNVKKPLTVDVIIKLFECRADKSDMALLDALARANGLLPKEYAERVKNNYQYAAKRNSEISRERMMKNAIIAGVAACGLPVKEIVNNPRLRLSAVPALYPRSYGDFMLDINSDANSSVIKEWAFYLYPRLVSEMGEVHRTSAQSEVRSIIEKISVWFLLDAWDPEEVRGMKVSFVFADREIYKLFIDALRGARLHNEMSVLFVDPEDYTVCEEVWLPGEYERLANISVFDVPAHVDDETDEEVTEDNE